MALFPAAQAKHLSIHLTLPNEVFFLFLVFASFFKKKTKKLGYCQKHSKLYSFCYYPKYSFLKVIVWEN